MSNAEMASYLVSLPISQFRAIKKAITVVTRGGMHREEALMLIVSQHQESHRRQREMSNYK